MGTNLKRDDPFHKQIASTVQLPAPCSGTLVTFEGRSANRKALVLTAGHCIGIGSVEFGAKAPGAGEVFKSFKQDNVFTINTPRPELRKACVGSGELVYATLTEIDIAVYELRETYQELEKRTGAVPLVVSRESRVMPGLKLRAPSGLHENEQACTLAADIAKVKEFDWTWGPLMRLAGCTFIGGASGSPLISEETGHVVGVVGTVYFEQGKPCSVMNPCEVSASGETSVATKGTSYGHYAHRLAACMNDKGDFDLSLTACALPK